MVIRTSTKWRGMAGAIACFLATTGIVAATGGGVRAAGPDADPAAAEVEAPWEQYILAPDSRQLHAEGIHEVRGEVDNPPGVLGSGATVLRSGSQVTLDFGVNVGGLVSLDFGDVSGSARIGLAFSETAKYVERQSEASTGGPRGRDGTVWVDATDQGTWSAPPQLLRGAFRYLTVFLDDDATVALDDIVLDYTASPLMEDLRAYPNHFYSSSDELNRLWYAGAYTTQLTTIAPDTGRVWPAPDVLWDNTAVTGVGESILVDGAKRDRTVWPGDLGISQGTAFVSTGDTSSPRNSIMTAYAAQRDTGELPYAGPEIGFYRSDTYHMWTLLATAEQMENTDDRDWLRSVWPAYVAGLDYIRDKVGDRDLLFIDETNDTTHESRIPDGEESMANVLFWRVLTTGAELATQMEQSEVSAELLTEADRVRSAIDRHLWDEEAGALQWYPDRADIHPQSANSLAAWWGLLDGDRADRAREHLRSTNWVEGGARTPERSDDLQLLFGSFELQAQLSGDRESQVAALDLMERQWGWMLENPEGPQSTFWESLRESGQIVSSYQSYAHGWATGPTRALTEQLLGIQPVDGGSRWAVAPHPADIASAEGRLVTAAGPVDAAWERDDRGFTLDVSTPAGTTGDLEVPLDGREALVQLDDRPVWNSRSGSSDDAASENDGRLRITSVDGGDHTVTVRYLD